MKSLKRQGGFLVETVLGLVLFLGVVAAFIIPMQLEKQKDEAAESFARDIRYLITRIHQYQHYKITVEGERAAEAKSWPSSLPALATDYPGRFWNECSIKAETSGECRRPDAVPWSNSRIGSMTEVNYATAPYNTHFLLFIPTSQITDAKEWLRWSNPLMKIPGAKMIMGDVQITLRQATLALMFEDIVMRNGEATLTADWDVGGDSKITNVSDITLKGNNSQISVSEWLTQTHVVPANGALKKPDCPKDMTPDISLSVSSLDVRYPWTLSGSIKPWITDWGIEWSVGLDMTLYNITTGEYRQESSSGNVLAVVQCKK